MIAGQSHLKFIFSLLFWLPPKKVTKKVTATIKFAKTTPQKAKILNVAD